MQLTSFADYSLRVLIYTAARPTERCTVDEIATAFGISRHHLVKVVHGLHRLGYLETYRGRGGGLVLARPAEAINLGEVVRRTEETLGIVECLDRETNTCPLTRACGLKGALEEALASFLAVLDRYTIADLIADPRWHARVISLTFRAGDSHA
jgi:Rrf2 family nitric oxide-sensitive transcriptional repressor